MSNPVVVSSERAMAFIEQAVAENLFSSETAHNLKRWLTEPQYSSYVDRLLGLIAEQNFDELNRLFWERIPFGTGGRRGPMSEFGSATMNDRTIAESAHGLAVYVKRWRGEQLDASRINHPPRAVVAFDSRHRSKEFARRTASVLAAHGFQVLFFPEPRATPELSFAVRRLQCDAGVMISASHNPPSDNGFKAYWSTGGQLLPPHDQGVMECVDAATEIPSVEFDAALASGAISLLGDDVDQAYVDAVCAISLSSARDISALYTPLHGVGESSVYRVVKRLGFERVLLFEPQQTLDGSFPNVPGQLPNPERREVFGPAIEHAKQTEADLILASDPDADRIAVAVRDRSGEYVCLTGNQLSALLTDHVLSHRSAQGSLSPEHFIVQTLVTTPLITAIGLHYGIEVVRDVLVGFKHIAHEVDSHGPERFVFATEESIGFMAGDYCRDKDAAVGAVFALELAAELKQKGQTMLDRLDELYMRHGVYADQSMSIVSPGSTGQARQVRIMRALRESQVGWCGPAVWEAVRDYDRHEARSLPSNTKIIDLPAPSSDLLIFGGQAAGYLVSLAVRPSGTEPKIKFYGFVWTDALPDLAASKQRATACLNAVMSAMQTWIDSIE